MQIHELTLAARKKKKVIGRGGKRGTTSGKGTKGQKARSGGNVDPLFEGGRSTFTERLKKTRGFKSIHPKKVTITLHKLERAYEDGEMVSFETLLVKKLVDKSARAKGIKIVSTGILTKKLGLDPSVSVSESARTLFKINQ
jgi:large subunit ribosomal protein L15